VAGLSGICRHATFDGQAAIAMEAAAVPQERGHWFTPDILDFSVSPAVIRLRPILLKVSRETSAGVPAGLVAARFHNTVAKSVAAAAARLCSARRLRTVCLSGGCFQNLRLRVWVARLLLACGLQVINNQQVPVNDGGLSLGQAVVAGRVTMHGADSGRHAPCVGHRT
jgi:hydrogenase maturation protein HypF